MWTQIIYVAVALALVALNAFYVLAEFALVRVRVTRMRELAEQGNVRAAMVLRILDQLDAYLSTCQLGITIASLGLGWIGEPAFARLIEPVMLRLGISSPAVVHSTAFAFSFGLVTFLHVVLGELAPKSVAIRKTEWAALFSAAPIRLLHILFFPAMWLLNSASNLILRIAGIAAGGEHGIVHSHSEIKMIVGASHDQGMFTLSRLLMMENVIDFGTLTADDVMIPASKVAYLDPAKPWKENRETIEHTLHSRYLLAEERPSRVVHVKDMLLNLSQGGAVDMNAIARPALRVPPGIPVEELLRKFLPGGPHLAVVEKDGALVGIVTLEDILEELVGPINDEFEKVKDYRLSEIVAEEAVVLDIVPAPKQDVVRRLALGIAAARKDVDVGKAVAAVMKREALASTGLGMGVAIPHGRVEGLVRPAAAVGRTVPGGIDFGSMDGKPVNLVFLILSPPHDEGAHLHILEKISSLLLSDYLRERLITAQSAEEILKVFRESDKSLPA
ncbi:MAG: DUF21 domain-containing protein [Candidatus Brocadiae bacterium]|nr:DUF21 domain-containing protein [Candidatus Brocadiia bacterium]